MCEPPCSIPPASAVAARVGFKVEGCVKLECRAQRKLILSTLEVYGLRFMGYGLWCMAYGSWVMVHGSWCMGYGAWVMVLGSGFRVFGFRVYHLLRPMIKGLGFIV
jgi:hypothetical protein